MSCVPTRRLMHITTAQPWLEGMCPEQGHSGQQWQRQDTPTIPRMHQLAQAHDTARVNCAQWAEAAARHSPRLPWPGPPPPGGHGPARLDGASAASAAFDGMPDHVRKKYTKPVMEALAYFFQVRCLPAAHLPPSCALPDVNLPHRDQEMAWPRDHRVAPL